MIGDTEDRHSALRACEGVLQRNIPQIGAVAAHALAVAIIEEICVEGLL